MKDHRKLIVKGKGTVLPAQVPQFLGMLVSLVP